MTNNCIRFFSHLDKMKVEMFLYEKTLPYNLSISVFLWRNGSLSSHSMKHQYVPHYGNNSHYKIKQIFQLKLEHEWSSNIYLKWEIKVNIVANEVENICLEINRAALYIGTHLILYGSKIKILALSEELYCKYVGFQQTFCTPCYRYIVIIQGKMWSLYMVDFFFSPFIPCPSSALFPQKSDDKWAIFFFF